MRTDETTDHGNGQVPPPPEPVVPESDVSEFWPERDILRYIYTYARAARVSPWALLGVLLVRTAARIPSNVVLPPLVGGRVSLNTYVALTSESGGGKGSAENAADDAGLELGIEPVPSIGPGSGEGIGHLFAAYDKKKDGVVMHAPSVILSAAEIDTLAALKNRQGSTLMAELRKGWFGEPLGFGYVDKAKRIPVERHRYRLGLVIGVQPARAQTVLEDVGAGTPQRLLWLPGDDLDAPDVAPARPDQQWQWRNPYSTPGGTTNQG